MPTIREYHDEATAHQLDTTIKATLFVQNVQQQQPLVSPKFVITAAIPLGNDGGQIAQIVPPAVEVPVLIVNSLVNHKIVTAAADLMPFAVPKTYINDVASVAINNNSVTHVKSPTSFCMALHNVRDEIAQGSIHEEDVVGSRD
jgi:hypothetical protein